MPEPTRSPTRIGLAVTGAVLALLAVFQFTVPWLVENQIESRLTESGGFATVDLEAFPAVALLFNDGDALTIEATSVELEESDADRRETLKRLDGFDRVEIAVANSLAGPMRIERFRLERSGPDDPYELDMSGTTTGSDLAGFGAEQVGLNVPLIDEIAGALDAGRTEIPIELELEVISREGRLAVRDGDATIAGYPTGPLVEIILAAIVARL